MSQWYLYIIEKNNKLYTGITSDLENRLRQHGNPELIYSEERLDKFIAAKREKEIKGWNKSKKLALAHLKK